MRSSPGAEAMSSEVQRLGDFRAMFDASTHRVWAATLRGIFPMAIAVLILGVADRWFIVRDWKYFLTAVAAVGMFLNGVRVIVQAWRRREQKVALFEDGFALWRNGALSTYLWREILELEVSPEFFGFTAICRSDTGRVEKVHFDAVSDPTNQLRELCRELEAHTFRDRLPTLRAAIDKGEEVTFVRKVWGKEVGTKIGISRAALSVTPRYQTPRLFEWPEIESITLDRDHLTIRQVDHGAPLLHESVLAMPGGVAIVALAEHARSLQTRSV